MEWKRDWKRLEGFKKGEWVGKVFGERVSQPQKAMWVAQCLIDGYRKREKKKAQRIAKEWNIEKRKQSKKKVGPSHMYLLTYIHSQCSLIFSQSKTNFNYPIQFYTNVF
jgi:hypothetical protein